MNRKYQFIEKAIKVHGDKYDYSLVNCVDYYTNIKIICKIHGIFEQLPSNHKQGYGCKKCGEINSRNKQAKSSQQFIKDAIKKHGNKYDYSKVNYITADFFKMGQI